MLKEELKKYLLPELDLLTDEQDKDKVLSVWLEAVEAGKWGEKGLENSGVSTVMRPDCPEDLMLHTRHVTAACAALYQTLEPLFAAVGHCNREDLLVGALVHDVGKLLEMDYADGRVTHTHYGDLFVHPVSGAYLAKKYGLNQNVVHMVLTHSNLLSPEGPRAFATAESLILKYIDEMCYKYVELHCRA